MSDVTDWPKAVAVLGGALFGVFALTMFFPLPWLILADWVGERAKTKRILAEARLQEAKNAASLRKTEETKT